MGIAPVTAADLPGVGLPTNGALILLVELLVVGVWVFGPAWILFRVIRVLQARSVMPVAEAQRLLTEYGRLLEERRLRAERKAKKAREA